MSLRRSIGISLMLVAVAFGSCNRVKQNSLVEQIEVSNPVLPLDYSDPDVIAVNGKYYLTASSFNSIPGLPILESDDLVNWKLLTYAIHSLEPDSVYRKPGHGNGVWAPAIRFHNGLFYIYYSDPDYGIFFVSSASIEGPWSKPVLVKAGKGWIDPCPFWDEDGSAWLIHAWAGSRAGIKSSLLLHRMSADGKSLLDNGVLVFDGHKGNGTVEGPKMYKRNGYYYIFAPAGGVTQGWQLVMRSQNILGPYETRKVLHQGSSPVNGPHQGAWITDNYGKDWFFHFQDMEAFGRLVHLQALEWRDNWPLIGINIDENGLGEPAEKIMITGVNSSAEAYINSCSDEFDSPGLNMNWQWHANVNPQWGFPSAGLGFLRLNAWVSPNVHNLWDVPNLLLQKFPAIGFKASAEFNLYLKEQGDKAGLLIMGSDYAYMGIERKESGNYLVYRICLNADKGSEEQTMFEIPWNKESIVLHVEVGSDGKCTFSYSDSTKTITILKEVFTAKPGRWVGAKCGLFSTGQIKTNDAGFVNVNWFRFSPLDNTEKNKP